MSQTITEKILANHVREGSQERGQDVGILIDQCLTQDSTGTMAWLEFEALGLDRVKAPDDRVTLWGQILQERQWCLSSDPIRAFRNSGQDPYRIRLAHPHLWRIGHVGHRRRWNGRSCVHGWWTVLSDSSQDDEDRDIALEVLRRISVKGGVGYFLEFAGPGIKTLTVPERATITNMGTETGATSSIFPSDEVTREFLRMQGRKGDWVELKADEDAVYDKTVEIDLSTIKPLVAMPGMPDNVFDIEEVKGTKLDQIFIGSCTNGSYFDIKIVAEMLKGKKVCRDIDVIVSPGSRQSWEMLMEDGSFLELTKAGVRMIEPGCNACIGIGFVPGHGHLSLRTVNRNWAGRGGSKFGKLALCGPQVAAASALTGTIADPRDLPSVEVTVDHLTVDDYLILDPKGREVEIRRGPNIVAMGNQTPLEPVLKGEVLLKLGDGISTDAILPAGPLTQHLRSNLPEISKFTFYYEDETFAQRSLDAKGGFLIGGDNYGQGSSREHAALAPWHLGIKAVFANSSCESGEHGHRTSHLRHGCDRSGRSARDRCL